MWEKRNLNCTEIFITVTRLNLVLVDTQASGASALQGRDFCLFCLLLGTAGTGQELRGNGSSGNVLTWARPHSQCFRGHWLT